MKRETKKKVFNFALATSIVASVVTPLAIVLGKESNLLFNNKKVKQTTNDGQFVGSSYIDENDYTLDLNSALGNQNNSNNRTISIGTSNIVKSIPQGYIVVSGDSNNKNQELICLDKNDPTKKLWKLSLGNSNSNTNINIYGVEYTPYDNGRLIVLYSQDANDATYKDNSQVKFKVFKNFDSTPILDFEGYGRGYKNAWEADSGGRLDTWAINPIFNFSGEVTKYLIYCKEQYFTNNDNNGRVRFYLIDIKEPKNNNNKCYEIKFRWEGANYSGGRYDGNKKIILSIASFEKDNNIYTLPLIVDFNDNKLELGFYRLSSNDNSELQEFNILNNRQHINFDVTINSQIFNNNKNNSQLYEKAADLVKSSISSSTFQRTDSGLKIVFALNMNPNGTNNSPHRGGRFVILEISNNGEINTSVKNLFHNSDDFLVPRAELWHGYFSNEVIARLGIDSTTDNKNLTPFIGIGWNQDNLNGSPWFVSTIKNPFDSNVNYSFNSSSNTDSNFRIYRVNGSASGYQNGIYLGQANNFQQYGDGLLRVGIPILEYNDQKNNDVFDRNILFTWNNKQKAIVINQKNRGGNINNVPTYGYYTRLLEANSSNGSDYEIDKSKFSLVDMDTLTEETIKNEVFNLIKTKYLQNVVGNAQLVENSINFNFPEGKIELKINVGNKWFNNEGKLVIEQNNTSKVFNISIIGFAQKQTNLTNTNINLYGANSGNYNDGFGKQSYTYIPSEVISASESNEKYWNLRKIIFKELVINKFNNQIQNFRNFNYGNESQLTSQIIQNDFKKIFKKFEFKKYSNENGEVEVDVTIDKNYVYTNSLDYSITIKFLGLRQIKETKLNNIDKENPLNINSLSDFNIPNEGTSLTQTFNGVITEQKLKEELAKEIQKDYSNASKENGFDTGDSGKLASHLPFIRTFSSQNGLDLSTNTNNKITYEHIDLSNYEFFAAYGILKVDVKLKVWNSENGSTLKHSISIDNQQPNANLTEAPSATWYISGFKHDNVETNFKNDQIWQLSGIDNIKISAFNNEENKNKIEQSLTNFFKSKPKELILLPFWVSEEELQNDRVLYDLQSATLDVDDPKYATLKVKLQTNMWVKNEENGKVEKKLDVEYQDIKITGFLNETPIPIDSSEIWDFSKQVVTNQVIFDLDQTKNNQSFKKYLSDIENKITEYIFEQDKNIGNVSLEVWKNRLGYEFKLENSQNNYELEFKTQDELIVGMNSIFSSKYHSSRLGAFYNEDLKLNNGWKLWIKIGSKNLEEWTPIFKQNENPKNEGKANGLYGLIDTSKLTVSFSMEDWFRNLETVRGTQVKISSNDIINEIFPPKLTNPNSYGYDLDYKDLEFYLKQMGYQFEYSWIDKEGREQKQNELPINFTYDSSNPSIKIKISYDTNTKNPAIYIFGDLENGNLPSTKTKEIKLSLNVKTEIKVELSELNSLQFFGTTKKITNIEEIKAKELEIISQVKEENKIGKIDEIQNEIESLDIDVLYSINHEEIVLDSSRKIWLTLEELNLILSNNKINFSSNKVLAKFVINNSNDYQITNEEQVINQEQFESNANFKVFIHITDPIKPENIIENLKLKGTQDQYVIEGLEEWKIRIPKGLNVEFNSVDENGNPNSSSWSKDPNTNDIDASKNYWLRFEVQDGFVFEQIESSYTKYTDPIKLDTSLIVVALKLKSEWLNKIELSGNIKDLTINEEKALKEVEDAKQMIEPGIIKIQYSINGLNNWFNLIDFQNELKKLKGSLSSENWIIKREDIKARFILNSSSNKVDSISIDGKVIYDDIENVGISIINETTNTNVRGYINIEKIIDVFKEENFEVIGTNRKAKLIIKNLDKLNNLLSRYASDNIFQILYSNNKNETNFDPNNAIWKNGQTTLMESMDLNLDYTNKEFCISFIGIENYDVYNNEAKQENGYILNNINVIISIEIDNPLKDKNVKFNFKDEQERPYFYQNKGGFWVQISNNTSSRNDLMKFNEFINSLNLPEDQRESLELAYYVSEYKLSNEQLKEIHKNEILYNKSISSMQKYGVWKTLDTSLEGWKEELGLLVDDYVVVTIRIKEDNLTTQDKSGYIVKYDEDYIPFQSRVYGYKIKTSEIKIDESSIQLENVGQAESASYALDGYARLKNISLIEDENKNYLGASLKINYFNDFYKDENDNILVSGSGQVLVKRNSSNTNTNEYYKDENGDQILDSENKPVKIELDLDGKPTTPTKNSDATTEIILEEYFTNKFKFSSIDKSELKYNFFQNQYIEFELLNKKGQAEDDEYDYYVDNSETKKSYTFKNIKFPITNETNIRYEFNSQEFLEKISNPNNVKEVYKNALDTNKEPINGQSKLVEMFSITRKENKVNDIKITTLNEINSKLQTDFNGQVILKATHTSIDGQITEIENGDISKIETLKNGDRFRIEIVSKSNDLVFAQQPTPLIFTISGLYEQPIDEQLLKYLRVKQGGLIDGQGSFNILVDDPSQSNINSDLKTSLNGYKFLVRVWDKNKTIKHDWTEHFISINNLSNGDKVEWKLVSQNGSPLVDSYYNTIANQDKHNLNENKYSFIQINQEGFVNKNISEPQEGIGKNPENQNEYPENSGLLISGLKSKDDSSYTTISFEEFIRVMNLMNFGYSGINGSGNMISSTKTSDVKLNVLGRNSQTFTLDYLIKNNYISFYYNNDSSSQLNSFNWDQVKDENGNWLTSPGTLSNGDSVRIVYKDPTMSTSYEYYAPIVSGLQNKSDNMSMFSWIGIGLATFATLGIFAFIYIYVRNRKLK